jgi:hypothetical protein
MWQVDLAAAQHLLKPLFYCMVKFFYDYGLSGFCRELKL